LTLLDFYGRKPKVHKTCFIAPNATLIGSVTVSEHSSIWYNTVIRADLDEIVIGKKTCIQDNSVLHVDEGYPTYVGDNAIIGHRVVLHGCKIGNNVLIGIGAVVLNGVEIGESCVVAAGSVVTEKTRIPVGSLALGIPAKVVKKITDQHMGRIRKGVEMYAELAQKHKNL
jgi:carbonic anhydrase/acetyltransferase-like protein (isoleucine patch superfamily)